MSSNNAHDAGNGDSTILFHWPRLLSRFRRRRPVKQPSVSADDNDTDHHLYSDGTYPHGKATTGVSQWLLQPSGRLPVPAFGLHGGLIRRMLALAATVPAGEEGRRMIAAFADAGFRSCWAEVRRRKFTAELEESRRHLARLHVERAAIQQNLDKTDERIPEDAPRFELPHGSVALAAFAWWVVLWLGFSLFTVFNTCNLIAQVLQDPVRAWCFATPLVLVPIGLKLALDRSGRAAGFLKSPWMGLAMAAAGAFFAWQLGENFGHTRTLDQIVESETAGHDWRVLLWASLGLEITGGLLLYNHLCGYLVRRQAMRRNPEFNRLLERAEVLDARLNTETRIAHQKEGELEEFEASRQTVIAAGLAFHRLLDERRQIVEENRINLERLHQLWLPPEDRDDESNR